MTIREAGLVLAISLPASVTVITEEPADPVAKGLVRLTLSVLYGVISCTEPEYSAYTCVLVP